LGKPKRFVVRDPGTIEVVPASTSMRMTAISVSDVMGGGVRNPSAAT
jgi:hypothetical protein